MLVLACGLLIALFSEAQEARRQTPYQQLLNTLEHLKPGNTIDIKIGTEKEQYDVGDLLEIRFQTNQDCYPVLMDISTIKGKTAEEDAPGEIIFFLPNYQFPGEKIAGGRVYSTLSDFGLKIRAASPYTYETCNILCSPQKLDLFKADFSKERYYTIQPDDEQRLTALVEQLAQLQHVEWSGNSLQIQTGPSVRSRGIRKSGALPPIGSTGTTGKWFPPIGSTGTTGKTDEQKLP
jgi:hypothetical protein